MQHNIMQPFRNECMLLLVQPEARLETAAWTAIMRCPQPAKHRDPKLYTLFVALIAGPCGFLGPGSGSDRVLQGVSSNMSDISSSGHAQIFRGLGHGHGAMQGAVPQWPNEALFFLLVRANLPRVFPLQSLPPGPCRASHFALFDSSTGAVNCKVSTEASSSLNLRTSALKAKAISFRTSA